MERFETAPRPGWQAKLEEVGLTYHSNGIEPQSGTDGGLWWHEASHWRLTSAEVDLLDDATAELHARCLDAVDFLVNREPTQLQELFGLPDWMANYLRRSWLRGDPTLMGRFDLAFDDRAGVVKMLEYNADTPTLAIETGVAQWFWLQDTHPEADQFNSLHEKLLAAFRELAPRVQGNPIHFAAFEDSAEEWAHATYFRDLAEQAGIRTVPIDIPRIGWNGVQFMDEAGARIRFLHKLYPWEWVERDAFGPNLASDSCGVLEPPWKAVLSDKMIMAVLWRLFPGHPNLLETVPGRVELGGPYVRKPCLGREGSNIAMVQDGLTTASTDGPYGGDTARFVTQAMARLPQRDGWNAVIGSWIVGAESAGIIIREGRQAIMRDTSRVVPHYF
ncbi:glutathionylspermidine synthase family protein [Roseococcus sp. SYP-B2431]|uniref:glutathionylspermidine synthase family protein n=1 Tax=Roseococcus sp. SYP-B2431 TaxID=2496640 RepID=UPI0010404EF5|nr:glutathionylspermidine synthase family protein [Roseococcus sp. SYP-B2431]TCH96669.1 glutathionylspermidine synthase family protein [Roseococcus sp. SYP-B2431]